MIEKYPYTDLSTMNLDWVILKVKEMIAAWAETKAEWTDTKAEFEELKLWISNYFTNLDVQQEINNKLDAMALDGTLSDIIAPHVAAGLPAVVADQIGAVVAAQISAVVADQLPAVAAAQLPAIVATETAGQAAAWLETHVDPDTGYVIDNSLTIAGAAADAKATGDEITDLKSALEQSFPVLTFVVGYIDENGVLQTNNSFRTTEYISALNYIFLSGTFRNLLSEFNHLNCYDEDKNFISGMITGGAITEYDNEKIALPDNTRFIRVTATRDDYETVAIIKPIETDYVYENLDILTTHKTLDEKINSNAKQELSFVQGYIDTDGSLVGTNPSFKTTDYLCASGKIYVTGVFKNLISPFNYINCYDLKKRFISGLIVGGTPVTYNLEEINLPEGTLYFRITTAAAEYETIEVYLPAINYGNVPDIESIIGKDIYKEYEWLGFGAFDEFVSIGDSLSVGFRTKSDHTVLTSDKPHSWPAFVEKRTGTTAFWTGVGGATTASWLETSDTTWGLPYCRSLGAKNLYVVSMGANERTIPIGTISDIEDENPSTLYGYVGKLIRELRTISPTCFIVCTGVSRKQESPDINAVYKNVCAEFTKCYYMDCESEFNGDELSQYFYESHYTITGYDVIGCMFNNKLIEVMRNNVSDFLFIDE